MANGSLSTMFDRLRRLIPGNETPLTDRELLARFDRDHDQSAFAQLVERHGSMVLGVCRRVLNHQQDAEDAFQATFLVLARKANSGNWDDSVGHWLYEVALRTAQKSRVTDARRQARERRAGEMTRQEPTSEQQLVDLHAVLDEEIHRLPKAYVMPLVLCCLQELTHEQAAKQLGVTEGTIRARLWRGRELLRQRLGKRGVTMTASVLTTLLSQSTSVAQPSADLMARTVMSAVDFATGTVVNTAANDTSVRLAEGVLHAMMTGKIKLIALIALTIGLTITGAGIVVQQVLAEPTPQIAPKDSAPIRPAQAAVVADDDDNPKMKKVEGILKGVDVEKNIVLVDVEDEDKEAPGTESFDLAKDAKILFGKEPVKLSELKVGMKCRAVFNDKQTSVIEFEANWPKLRTKAKEIDAATGKLTIEIEVNNQEFELPFAIRPNAIITVDGLKATIADVPTGEVTVQFSPDRKQLIAIESAGGKGDLPATFASADIAKNSVRVTVGIGDDERKVELAFEIAKNAKVRYHGTDLTLADLKKDMRLRLKLADDRRTIVSILADDPAPKNDDDD